jgi:hypothetical protein
VLGLLRKMQSTHSRAAAAAAAKPPKARPPKRPFGSRPASAMGSPAVGGPDSRASGSPAAAAAADGHCAGSGGEASARPAAKHRTGKAAAAVGSAGSAKPAKGPAGRAAEAPARGAPGGARRDSAATAPALRSGGDGDGGGEGRQHVLSKAECHDLLKAVPELASLKQLQGAQGLSNKEVSGCGGGWRQRARLCCSSGACSEPHAGQSLLNQGALSRCPLIMPPSLSVLLCPPVRRPSPFPAPAGAGAHQGVPRRRRPPHRGHCRVPRRACAPAALALR